MPAEAVMPCHFELDPDPQRTAVALVLAVAACDARRQLAVRAYERVRSSELAFGGPR